MCECKKFEKKISGNGNPISLECLEHLIPKGKKCVCKIYYEGFATGFFVKFLLVIHLAIMDMYYSQIITFWILISSIQKNILILSIYQNQK